MSTTILRAPWLLSSCIYYSKSLVTKNLHTSCALACRQSKVDHSNPSNPGSTVDKDDVARHTQLRDQWWDPCGPMKALHSYNLLRVPFIRDGLVHSDEAKRCLHPLKGLNILDVGCGGGVLSEPLAILGAKVTGIDASHELVNLASEHSKQNDKLRFNMPTYICSTIEQHAETHENTYDAVVASEIIEHVNHQQLFVKACVKALKPNGRIFFTTPNRTQLSNLFVINVAEYILKAVPKGTHQIEKFITPTELSFMLERNGCHVELIHGMFYSIINNRWYWTRFQHLIFALQAVKLDNDPRNVNSQPTPIH